MASVTLNRLETLQPEILLMIVKSLPDLESLHSMLRASPASFRLFNDDFAVEITEAVLAAGFLHGHIRVIICIIAMIRSGTLPISDLDSFKKRVTEPCMKRVYELGKDTGMVQVVVEDKKKLSAEEIARLGMPPESFTPIHLSRTTSPAILRSILATSYQITCLSINCFEYYLHRFRTLRRQHLVEEDFRFCSNGLPNRPDGAAKIRAWQFKPLGKYCEVVDVGPPSWVEEQRAIRAFWRL